MYPLSLLKIAERDSGKSTTEEHNRRKSDEDIVIVRIKSTIILHKKYRWLDLIINNLIFLVNLIFHLHYCIHYILIQVAFICLNR
jgi:hypothetical protein